MPDDLPQQIKEMMIEELMLQMTAADISDTTPIFGPDGLGLDSVDALQLVVGLEKRFGLKLADGAGAKKVMENVESIAVAIRVHQGV